MAARSNVRPFPMRNATIFHMKRVLIVTDAWYPQVNGVVTVLAKMSAILEDRGYEVNRITPEGFISLPLPFYPEIQLALFPRRKVARIIRHFNPDAIHIATEGPLGLAARRYCLRHSIPFTTSYHTHFQLHIEARMGGMLTSGVNAWLRWFHRPAVHTMVATQSLKHILDNIKFEHIEIWPLGVDTSLFVRTNQTPIDDLTKPVFVYFGRLAAEKNVEEFLRLDLPGSLLVIGDGPDRPRLEKKYGASARFVGYKRGQELVDYLSGCDVFVFPSTTETFGLVIVEALALGIPVAAHNVMGPRDIITEGKDGYLDSDLREAALKCLTLSPDDCRAKASQYSWEHSADAFLSHLVYLH